MIIEDKPAQQCWQPEGDVGSRLELSVDALSLSDRRPISTRFLRSSMHALFAVAAVISVVEVLGAYAVKATTAPLPAVSTSARHDDSKLGCGRFPVVCEAFSHDRLSFDC